MDGSAREGGIIDRPRRSLLISLAGIDKCTEKEKRRENWEVERNDETLRTQRYMCTTQAKSLGGHPLRTRTGTKNQNEKRRRERNELNKEC